MSGNDRVQHLFLISYESVQLAQLHFDSRMVDAFETPKEVVAVTEFVKGGDLNKVVNANKSDQQVSTLNIIV